MMPSYASFINTLGRVSFVILPLLFSVFGANAASLKTPVFEQKTSDDTSYQQELLFVSIHKGHDICYVVLANRVSESLKESEDLYKDEKDSKTFKMSLRTSRKEFKEARLKVDASKKMKPSGDYGNHRDEENVLE